MSPKEYACKMFCSLEHGCLNVHPIFSISYFYTLGLDLCFAFEHIRSLLIQIYFIQSQNELFSALGDNKKC